MPDDVGELIISPVPGTVLEVMVSVGDGVRRGSPLMLLGAMVWNTKLMLQRTVR